MPDKVKMWLVTETDHGDFHVRTTDNNVLCQVLGGSNIVERIALARKFAAVPAMEAELASLREQLKVTQTS